MDLYHVKVNASKLVEEKVPTLMYQAPLYE